MNSMIRADFELCSLDFLQCEEELFLYGLRMLVDTYHILREGFSDSIRFLKICIFALVDRHVLNQMVH
jgi:hypothetical protein